MIPRAIYAEDLSYSVTVRTDPEGRRFQVDGAELSSATGFRWAPSSQHILNVRETGQSSMSVKADYVFAGWQTGSGLSLGSSPTIAVTEDGSVSSYVAVFTSQYALTLNYNACVSGVDCQAAGTVTLDGVFAPGGDYYETAGKQVVLVATAGPGYLFAGWKTPSGTVANRIYTVTVDRSMVITPLFVWARSATVKSVPDGLKVYVDGNAQVAPAAQTWAVESTHTVGAATPQQDSDGNWWVFSSWSDGGTATHSVGPIASVTDPLIYTVTYARAGVVGIGTSPNGLKITVDGYSNWPSNLFRWAPGEQHIVEAPAQQTDSSGRIYKFVSWSNGGDAKQTYTVPDSVLTSQASLIATYTALGRLKITGSTSAAYFYVDGAVCKTPCDVQKPVGTVVHIQAASSIVLTDGARADFVSWSGTGVPASDGAVTLGTTTLTLNAIYRTMNLLTLSSNPEGAAVWTAAPTSADGYYVSGTRVTVSAKANTGYKFRALRGDIISSTSTGTVSLDGPRSVVAWFDDVPYLAGYGVLNSAGVTPVSGVAPGSIASAFGSGLTTDTEVGPSSPLAQTLAGLTAQVGDHILPLFFAAPGQVNFQVPPDLDPGTYTLLVNTASGTQVATDFTVVRDAPGLFTTVLGDVTYAIALHADGSLVTPDAPARRGETLTLYGTGFGPTTPQRLAGFALPAKTAYPLTDSVSVVVGDATWTPASAQAASGKIGLDTVTLVVPATAPSGSQDLHVVISEAASNTAKLAIE